MNIEHLRAFLWLRWRLFLQQMQRGGAINTVMHVLLVIGGTILGVNLLVGSFLVGLFAFEHVSPVAFMYVWDGIVALFLFVWMIGLLSELQRSDALSLDKFLHLPHGLAFADDGAVQVKFGLQAVIFVAQRFQSQHIFQSDGCDLRG